MPPWFDVDEEDGKGGKKNLSRLFYKHHPVRCVSTCAFNFLCMCMLKD